MKKIILLLFFFISIVSAKEIDVQNRIITIPHISDYRVQGFTCIDDKIVVAFIDYDETKSILKLYDISNGNELKSVFSNSIGHANDIAYNPNTDYLYIVHGGGTNIVHVYDTDLNYIKDVDAQLPIRSLTYIYDNDSFAARTVASGFFYHNDLTLKSSIPFVIGMNFSSDLARQGWEYYDGYIFYANWSWVRLGGDNSNLIYVYDLNGNQVDYFHTGDTLGELEDVSFYNDQMVLGFDAENSVDFYLEDIPEISHPIDEVVIKKEDVGLSKYIVYGIICFIVLILFIFFIIIKKRF